MWKCATGSAQPGVRAITASRDQQGEHSSHQSKLQNSALAGFLGETPRFGYLEESFVRLPSDGVLDGSTACISSCSPSRPSLSASGLLISIHTVCFSIHFGGFRARKETPFLCLDRLCCSMRCWLRRKFSFRRGWYTESRPDY